jgi:hypothetical protein
MSYWSMIAKDERYTTLVHPSKNEDQGNDQMLSQSDLYGLMLMRGRENYTQMLERQQLRLSLLQKRFLYLALLWWVVAVVSMTIGLLIAI